MTDRRATVRPFAHKLHPVLERRFRAIHLDARRVEVWCCPHSHREEEDAQACANRALERVHRLGADA